MWQNSRTARRPLFMKLAIVAPRFAEGSVVGGAETLLRELARYAVRRGDTVHLLTTCATDHFSWNNDREPGVQEFDGLQVHFFPVNEDRDLERFLSIQERIDKRQAVSRADQETWLENSVCSRELIAYLESDGQQFDAILAGPYLFGITWQVSRVHPERTWLVPCLHDESFAYLDVMGDMFRSVHGLLFNAAPEQQLAESLYGGLASTQKAVVGMGLELFEVDANAFAKRHGITSPYILYCGRREAGKNTPLLLDYIDTYRQRRHPDLKLVLTGSGEFDAPESLKDHILDFGFVSEQEKHEAMAGATAFFHPSTNESFGIVLLESWLARTPAIVHARSEVLRHQCEQSNAGFWFQFYPEFEAMLDALLSDPQLAETMGARGREYVLTTYSWEAVGERLFSALAR